MTITTHPKSPFPASGSSRNRTYNLRFKRPLQYRFAIDPVTAPKAPRLPEGARTLIDRVTGGRLTISRQATKSARWELNTTTAPRFTGARSTLSYARMTRMRLSKNRLANAR